MIWKIADLTREVKKELAISNLSKKTVDTWFRQLEKKGIHYVNRIVETNEKVYDELDLEIAVFIRKKREENWPLAKIFAEIEKQFTVRSFPLEEQDERFRQRQPQIKEAVLHELKKVMEEVAAHQVDELKKQMQFLLHPEAHTGSTIDERERKFQEMVLRKRIEYHLEMEARNLWSFQPEEERFVRKGWFRKEENRDKRELFVKEYVYRNYENRLRKELFAEN